MIEENELMEVRGGGSKWFIITIGGLFASFLAGIIDGYVRPLACNK